MNEKLIERAERAEAWAALWKRKAKESRTDARRSRREYLSADNLFWNLVDTTARELDALDRQLHQARSWSKLWKRKAKLLWYEQRGGVR